MTGAAPRSEPEGPGGPPGAGVRSSDREPSSGGAARSGRSLPDLVLPVHLVFVALLGVATIVLFSTPATGAPCCLPIAIFGVFTLVELIVVLAGIAVAGTTGRHSLLAIVDAMISAPLVALVPPAFASTGGPSSTILPVALGMLVVGLASAILAARVVREEGYERIVLGAALILLAAFSVTVPLTTIVPVAVLVTLFWPHLEATASNDGEPGATLRSNVRVIARRGPPDGAAILARRGPGSEVSRAAVAPPDPPDPA